MNIKPIQSFTEQLISWQSKSGRHDLPWQTPAFHPYRVWVSEIMLQQTQVSTVKRYFLDYMTRWPDLKALANAPEEEILQAWSGLGYYRRARNLHASAKIMLDLHQGIVPKSLSDLISLPGIGRSTAGAILSLGYDYPAPILDGNVKRIFARLHGISTWPGERQTEKQLWHLASHYVPKKQAGCFNQALMDLGATICTPKKPLCHQCPMTTHCYAFKHSKTEQLPKSAPKKQKKKQSIEFMVLNHKEYFWLQQRPEKGLWAKYWCFPEGSPALMKRLFDDQSNLIDDIIELPSIKHSLTHIDLTLCINLIVVSGLFDFSQLGINGQWCDHNIMQTKGLPKPVNKILDAIMIK